MLRIRTKVNGWVVVTLPYINQWYTFAHKIKHKSLTSDADNLLEAGQNHLAFIKKLQESEENNEQKYSKEAEAVSEDVQK